MASFTAPGRLCLDLGAGESVKPGALLRSSDVIGTCGGGRAGLAAGAGWIEEFELPFEDRGRLTDEYLAPACSPEPQPTWPAPPPFRRSAWARLARRLGFLGPRQLQRGSRRSSRARVLTLTGISLSQFSKRVPCFIASHPVKSRLFKCNQECSKSSKFLKGHRLGS